MYFKLFVFSVLLCNAFGQSLAKEGVYSYQLPDDELPKSLNVTLKTAEHEHFKIKIECYNYNSLKHFEIRLGESKEIKLQRGILLEFIKCFNNETDNENYKYGLNRWFNSLPYFSTEYHSGYPLIIQLDHFAVVNSDVLFENFDFKKFDTVTLKNIGFKSMAFLTNLYCESCVFEQNGGIDLNDFNSSIANSSRLQIRFNKLTNLNRDNLKKFKELKTFDIQDFDLDDVNAFNVPDLFEYNAEISEIKIHKSKVKLILHDQVFRGLKKLQRLSLQDLQLDAVSKDLFKDLDALATLYLSSNNIKSVDPETFETNKILKFISFYDNPFYTGPHDKVESINLHGETSYIELGDITTHSFDLLELLIKNPKVGWIRVPSYHPDTFNITFFTNINTQRKSSLNIDFRSGQPSLDLDFIKSFGNIIKSEYDLRDRIKIKIYIQFAGDAICHDCTMIKYLFPYFLNLYRNKPGFFFKESGVFIEIKIPESCNRLEEHYEWTFNENCSSNCTCKFSPLTDKVKIYCSNQNFYEIPFIPYPDQFTKLHSIDLNFENNSIKVLSSINQDPNVVKKLLVLNFKNNKIETLQVEGTNLFNNVVALNLCGNPILENLQGVLELKLPQGPKYVSRVNCFNDFENARVVTYIEENKLNDVSEYLDGLTCFNYFLKIN